MRPDRKIVAITALCFACTALLSGCDELFVESNTPSSTTTLGSTASQQNTTGSGSSSEDPLFVQTTAGTDAEQPQEEVIPVQPSVEFSHAGGIYAEEFDLALEPLEDGEIYYTLDGSDPSTSSTALLYNSEISITDRKGDKNVVSAVEPLLFAGSFNEVNKERNGFTCELKPPADEDVDKCTVIRAAVKKTDGTFGGDVSAAYFIGSAADHITGIKDYCEAAGGSLAVISISMNYDDLFDSKKGIYVKGEIFDNALEEFLAEERLRDSDTARRLAANYSQRGREWEREAAITLFEVTPNGAQDMLTQNCGIRIQGNYSRSDVQKGFRLYARKDYGENNFDYAVFGEDYLNTSGEVMDKFDTLVLRNGGNCAFTSKFNDTYWQSLVAELDCGTQKSRPCVVYLNGEYWGLYILQEDYTNDHMEDKYGVNKDDVVIYKGDAESLALGYKLDEGDLPEGVTDESYYFHELLDFFDTHTDLKSEADYEAFTKLVDPDSVMDYFAVNCWIDNKWDWPGKNWSMWKTTSSDPSNEYGDGRWRFLFYDIEFGGVGGEGDVRNVTIRNANYKNHGLLDMDTKNPAVLCFAYLMTNDSFRAEFCEKLSGLADGCFDQDTALEKLDFFSDTYGPLFEQFFLRYPETGDAEEALEGGYGTARTIREFITKRPDTIKKQVDYCNKILGD
ncbi:MAG: CotH kinase family protein [Oscillospiraceae bacterium]|nr:CotH kinase family protein [Oscillospiraceae bacterium]